jgi:hypothetical protein
MGGARGLAGRRCQHRSRPLRSWPPATWTPPAPTTTRARRLSSFEHCRKPGRRKRFACQMFNRHLSHRIP